MSRTKASSKSVVVVGRSMNSRAPARMVFTITCGCDIDGGGIEQRLPPIERSEADHAGDAVQKHAGGPF